MNSATSDPSVESRYAWLRAVASLTLMTLGGGGLYAAIVALKPIALEFGVSRSDASLAYTATSVGFGIGGIVMGRWSDRIGPLAPALVGGLGVGIGLIVAGSAPDLTVFILAQGVLVGLLGNAAVFVPLVADITRWFERNRGMAVAIVISGNYAAGALWPPVIAHGIDTVGWRQTYTVMGLFCLATMLPLAFVLWRTAPGETGSIEARAGRSRPLGFSRGALQCLLCVAGLSCCIAMAVPQAHIVAHATDLGHPAARAAEMLAVLLATGIISRLAYGWISDRIGGIRTLVLGSALQAVALLMFIPLTGLAALYAMCALFGLAQGGIVPAYTIIIRGLYPLHEVGWRIGVVMLATLVGMGLGGWLAGLIYDSTGSYTAAFLNAVGFNLLNLAIAGTLLWRARWRGGVVVPA